jgi:hypothetical protein
MVLEILVHGQLVPLPWAYGMTEHDGRKQEKEKMGPGSSFPFQAARSDLTYSL